MLSALKNFAVTFLIALLIFGIIGYFATAFVAGTVESIFESEKESLDEIKNNDTNPTGDESDTSHVSRGEITADSFNMLLVTTDYLPDTYDDYIRSAGDLEWYETQSSEATVGLLDGDYRTTHVSSIVLVRADKEHEEFVYLYLTPALRVYTNTGYHTLSEIYYLYGMDRLCEHISALVGMEIDYSFLVSGYNLSTFSTIAGTVTVNNPKDIYSDGRYNTYSMTTTRNVLDDSGSVVSVTNSNEFVIWTGEVELTPARLYSVLSVLEHSKADFTAKSTVVLDIAEAYIKHLASLGETTLRDTLYNLIDVKGAISTDFRPETVSRLYDLFACSDSYTSVKVAYPCDFRAADRSADDYFKPDNVKGLGLLEKYRKISSDILLFN